jgi:DNA repair ATPase RecN
MAFNAEIEEIRNRFEEILAHAEADNIKLNELNRNMKACSWLNKTYTNNIELYVVANPDKQA